MILLAAVTATDDEAAWMRGKLRLAGVGLDTPLAELCDVLVHAATEGVPGERLDAFRRRLDRAVWQIRPPDRDSWGLDPRAQQQMAKLAGQ